MWKDFPKEKQSALMHLKNNLKFFHSDGTKRVFPKMIWINEGVKTPKVFKQFLGTKTKAFAITSYTLSYCIFMHRSCYKDHLVKLLSYWKATRTNIGIQPRPCKRKDQWYHGRKRVLFSLNCKIHFLYECSNYQILLHLSLMHLHFVSNSFDMSLGKD